MDLVPLNTEVATVVPDDDVVSQLFPLSRSVEPLVDVAVETKSACSYLPDE